MKYIFFDIDGTLVGTKKGESYIPASTKTTLTKLKENGHVIGVASGRQMATVLPIAKELGINNIVSDGGYGLMYKGEILHINPLEKDLVLRLSQELLEKKIPFAFMTDSTSHVLHASPLMMNYRKFDKFEFLPVLIDENFDYRKEDAYKIFMAIHRGEEDLVETVDAHKIMRYFDDVLAFEPDDKYKGVKEIIEIENGHIEDLVYFGDGLNDIAMFEQVPFNIAMGNAIQELKDIAYFVTKAIDEDGIEYACKYFNFMD